MCTKSSSDFYTPSTFLILLRILLDKGEETLAKISLRLSLTQRRIAARSRLPVAISPVFRPDGFLPGHVRRDILADCIPNASGDGAGQLPVHINRLSQALFSMRTRRGFSPRLENDRRPAIPRRRELNQPPYIREILPLHRQFIMSRVAEAIYLHQVTIPGSLVTDWHR